MAQTLSVTEAARHFAEYINRVVYRGESSGLVRATDPLRISAPSRRGDGWVWAELAAVGEMIAPHNLWLAATSLAHGFTMITAPLREFARVPGLEVEVWGGPP